MTTVFNKNQGVYTMPPILYLIDGHALAYRTFFALTASTSDQLRTQSGEPTAGVFGFTSVLLRLIENEKPEYLAVAFDSGHSFRDQVYSEYKATRAKMPDDLRNQMARIRQVVDAFHIPRLELEDYEADDILGTIARQAVEKGLGVKIVTGDRDLLQLVDNRVIVNLAGNKLSEAKDYTEKDVINYLGVRPDQIVDYKALVGDHSDNIPGVSGVGEKTAVNLLTTYDTLDNIYNHLSELPKGVRTRLDAGRESAYLSKQLASILTNLQINLSLEDARVDLSDISALEELFRELEFRTLLTRLRNIVGSRNSTYTNPGTATRSGEQLSLFGQDITHTGPTPGYQIEVIVVDSFDLLQDMTSKLSESQVISLDTETTSTDQLRSNLVGISLAVCEGQGYYIPVGHNGYSNQLPLEQIVAALQPILSNQSIQKIGQNLKFDSMVLERYQLKPNPITFDTLLAEWLINPASRNLGLKDMAEHYLGIEMTHIEELIGRGKNQISMADVPISKAAPYAAADAEIVLRLMPILQSKMDELGVTQVFNKIEMPLIEVLASMEREGIALDAAFLHKMSIDLAQRMAEIEETIFKEIGYPFNLNSTQQLAKALFETLKLNPPYRSKKTSSGHYSTSADILEELRGQHMVVDQVLEYRELAKLKSTYLDALPSQINPDTGRIHTSFNQTGSVTGRLASSEPNLQNIPTRTELGRLVRNGFVATEGNYLLSVDYSQIELRILAHMSGDEAMLQAFRSGQDIHATTAAAIYNLPIESVTKDMRRFGKTINFGLVYGMSSFGLSRSTGLTLAESEDFVKAYFKQFPGVKKYLDGIKRMAAQQGYVETLLGRRRYFPNLSNQGNVNIRNREEREAINAPIQGTAADIMKLAMIKVPPALRQNHCNARLLLQVHDELVLEVAQEEIKKVSSLVRKEMEEVYPLSIKLETEARYGKTWGDMKVIQDT